MTTDGFGGAAVELTAREAGAQERAARLSAQLAELAAAAAGANADDEHDPEGATLAFEREQVAALLRQAESELAELAAARARMERGTYGVCAECHRAIPPERLEARPTARTCVECAGRQGA